MNSLPDVCNSLRDVSMLSRDVCNSLRDVSMLSRDESNLSRDVTHFLHNVVKRPTILPKASTSSRLSPLNAGKGG